MYFERHISDDILQSGDFFFSRICEPSVKHESLTNFLTFL